MRNAISSLKEANEIPDIKEYYSVRLKYSKNIVGVHWPAK